MPCWCGSSATRPRCGQRCCAPGQRVPVVLLRWQRPGDEDLAAALGIGLHLPSHLPRVRPPGLALCSTSCHSRDEVAAAAAAGFPMVTLSPFFSPGSKPDDTRPPLGLRVLGGLPPAVAVLALGGMSRAQGCGCGRCRRPRCGGNRRFLRRRAGARGRGAGRGRGGPWCGAWELRDRARRPAPFPRATVQNWPLRSDPLPRRTTDGLRSCRSTRSGQHA